MAEQEDSDSEVEENGSIIVRRTVHSSMAVEELQTLMTRSSHGL